MTKLTDERRAVLMVRFAETRTAELAREMGVSYRTLCRWAAEMGLEKSKDFRAAMSAIATAGSRERLFRKGHRGTCPAFDEEKEAYMRQFFATTPNDALAESLGVNVRTVRRWASRLGLKKDREVTELHRRSRQMLPPDRWFFTVATIRELYPDGHDAEAAERTGYSVKTVRLIAGTCGIRRSEAYMRALRETVAGKAREKLLGRKEPRTLKLEAAVREAYADTPTPEIARRLGISEPYVKLLAHRLGLRKSREFVHRVRTTQKKKGRK